MTINLSGKTIDTIRNSLKCSEQTLKSQLKNVKSNSNKEEILKLQLEEVKEALSVFEELLQ